MMNPIDTTFFHEQGFQVVRGLIPQDLIREVRHFLETRMLASLNVVKAELPFAELSELVHHPVLEDPERFHALSPQVRSIVSGHFDLDTRLAAELRLIPRSAPVRELIGQIFPGQGLRMHMPPTARFILPHNRLAGVPAHQDISYNKHMSDFVTMWCALVPTDQQCGGVLIHKGSQHLPEQPVSLDKTFWLEGLPDQGFEKVFFEMQPGDVLLLNRWIVHESMANRSDRIRFSVDHRFFGTQATSSKHYLELDTGEVIPPSD